MALGQPTSRVSCPTYDARAIESFQNFSCCVAVSFVRSDSTKASQQSDETVVTTGCRAHSTAASQSCAKIRVLHVCASTTVDRARESRFAARAPRPASSTTPWTPSKRSERDIRVCEIPNRLVGSPVHERASEHGSQKVRRTATDGTAVPHETAATTSHELIVSTTLALRRVASAAARENVGRVEHGHNGAARKKCRPLVDAVFHVQSTTSSCRFALLYRC